MSDTPQAQYFLLTTGLSRGQDDATAKKRVCTWHREYFCLNTETGGLMSVNEMEDGLMWFSVATVLPVPVRAIESTADVYDAAYKRFQAKDKATKAKEAKDKAFRKQLASGDIYGLHPERAQRAESHEVLAEAGFVQLYPEPAPERSEASLPPAAEASLPPALVAPAAGLLDDVTVLDLEFQGDNLLEIAAIRYVNGESVDEYVSLVRFHGQVWAAITQVTGLTTLHVSADKLPSEKQALQQFKKLVSKRLFGEQMLGDSLLVCHSIGADKRVIEAARKRQGATAELANPWLCTLALAKRRVKAGLLPSDQKCGLGELCQHFQIKTRGAHRAKADVLMCHQLLRKLHEQQPVTKLDLHGAPQPGKGKKSTLLNGTGLFAAA